MHRNGGRVGRGGRRRLGRIVRGRLAACRLIEAGIIRSVASRRRIRLVHRARRRIASIIRSSLGRRISVRHGIALHVIVSRGHRLCLEDDGLDLGGILVHDDSGHAEGLGGLPVAGGIGRSGTRLDGGVLALELGKARACRLERFLCSAKLGFSSGDLVRCAAVLFVEVHNMPLLS